MRFHYLIKKEWIFPVNVFIVFSKESRNGMLTTYTTINALALGNMDMHILLIFLFNYC